jgi:hypothetical protein
LPIQRRLFNSIVKQTNILALLIVQSIALGKVIQVRKRHREGKEILENWREDQGRAMGSCERKRTMNGKAGQEMPGQDIADKEMSGQDSKEKGITVQRRKRSVKGKQVKNRADNREKGRDKHEGAGKDREEQYRTDKGSEG